MAWSILIIIFGLALLAAGGEVLLRGAVSLSERFKLTPAVIGLTVVAAGTSVPELFVSALAALKGTADIAIGNVVGSNICNITLILGLAAILCPIRVTGSVIRLEYPVMVLVSLMLLILVDDLVITRLEAVLLLVSQIGFTTYMVTLVQDRLEPNEKVDFESEVKELSESPSLKKALLMIGLGIAILSVGANATVNGAVQIGKLFQISDRVIGLTIVAVGTSLPELVTSLMAALKGRDDIAIGNLVGSNLFNILSILGITSMLTPLTVAEQIKGYDIYWMLGTALILFPVMWSGKRVSRAEGVGLAAIFIIYTYSLI